MQKLDHKPAILCKRYEKTSQEKKRNANGFPLQSIREVKIKTAVRHFNTLKRLYQYITAEVV